MQVLLDNNGYIKEWVLDESQGEMGHADAVTIPTPSDIDVELFYKEFRSYKIIDGVLTKDDTRLQEIQEEKLTVESKIKLMQLRLRRENECFSVVNRGMLWYNTLTEDQIDELDKWYHAWLDVTETNIIPNKPEWIKTE